MIKYNNITAIIFCFNEERRLPYITRNLEGFCRVVVFDGGSTDGSEEYCRRNGIEFYKRPPDETESRMDSLKWIFTQVHTDYILHVACSHFYPRKLLDEFGKVAARGKVKAVFNDVLIYRYGQIVHRPAFRRIASACNFYQKELVNFEESRIHAELGFKFNSSSMIRLPGLDDLSIRVFQDENCESFHRKTLNYQVREAKEKFKIIAKINVPLLFTKPFIRFIYSYIRLGSFTKGVPGLVYALTNLVYDINLSIMIWELEKNLDFKNTLAANDSMKLNLLKNMFNRDIK